MTTATSEHHHHGAQVESSDRLSFTVFLAIALHALLILGISFNANFNSPQTPTLEVTLATHKAKNSPDKADFLAQHDQQASGTIDQAKEITTNQISPFSDPTPKEVSPIEQVKAQLPTPQPRTQLITTQAASEQKAPATDHDEETEQQKKTEGRDPIDTQRSAEIASLKAKLDQQRQSLSKKPRTRRQTSVSTKSAVDAAYINQWENKVTFIGNRNFPEEALRKRIFGSLRLATAINPNGTIRSVEVLQSSGHTVLDNAALQIVHQASPFDPLPKEVLKDYDAYEIIRTWHFEITGLSTTSNLK